ncbi:hypothetical protein [Pseudomonas sp. TE3610]
MNTRTRKSFQIAPGIKLDFASADLGSGMLTVLIFGGILWAIFQ